MTLDIFIIPAARKKSCPFFIYTHYSHTQCLNDEIIQTISFELMVLLEKKCAYYYLEIMISSKTEINPSICMQINQ